MRELINKITDHYFKRSNENIDSIKEQLIELLPTILEPNDDLFIRQRLFLMVRPLQIRPEIRLMAFYGSKGLSEPQYKKDEAIEYLIAELDSTEDIDKQLTIVAASYLITNYLKGT